ncbi:MAG: PAS domain S-box protein [Acidobacteriota bacterium]|nr:PAS domain S-box protein [Acidobacteriota bacterium]
MPERRLALMEAIAELSSEAFIGLDRDGHVDLWNAAAHRLFGWRSDEVSGKPLPLGLEHIAEVHSEAEAADLDVTTRAGETLCVGIRSRERAAGGWMYVAADRTVERAASEQLRVESRFRELLEAAPDAIIEVDREGKIVLLNRVTEQLFGYTREELLGSKVDLLLPEGLRQGHVAYRNKYWAHPTTRPMGRDLILSARRKDGHDIPVEISLSPVHSPDGTRVSAIIRDVTQRRLAEENIRAANAQLEARNREIQRADRLKSEFLASMSHELRTPLHTIIGFTELLAEELEGPLNDKQKRFVQHVHQDSVHLLALINDILDLSKIEAGRMELELESFDAREVVQGALDGIHNAARAKNLSVENRIVEVSIVRADRLRLREVLTNLLSNAVKFTPEGGTITVAADPLDGMIRFSVTDSGIGIALEDQTVIFDKFRQVSSTTRGVREGTGLGLAIVKHLVELHGGHLELQSEPGRGSCFAFTIPADQARKQPVVMVVEDEPAARELLAGYLNPLGIRTEFAASALTATSLASELRPDAITLDLLMPGRSGWRILEELRGSPETKTIPVLVISVLDRDREAVALGAAAYLQKPLKKDILIQALRENVPAVATLLQSGASTDRI